MTIIQESMTLSGIVSVFTIYLLLKITYTRQLEKKNEIKITKLKEETFGQLKELGNNILGNFGMSMDNFKFTQDSNTGSWSVQMQK